MDKRKICLLGASGSIGTQSVDVIRKHQDELELVAVSVNKSIDYLEALVNEFKTIKYVCIGDKEKYNNFASKHPDLVCYEGDEGLNKIATIKETNYLINALVGFKGLLPTILAIREKKDIGLANKETLVAGGHLIKKELKKHKVNLYPIDSEHSAIYQCLQGENSRNVDKLLITASGGSFRDKSREDLKNVTLEQALKHPNWSMGAKITIDSATMVNKGLEVIEAHWLFNMPYNKIKVVIHPESYIHSMVEFNDGAIKAQIGTPDMRVPIAYALKINDRLSLDTKRVDFYKLGKMNFSKPSLKRYPALKMAYEVGKKGGSLPCVFNASNEICVNAFINGKIPFLAIEGIISKCLLAHTNVKNPSLEEILMIDNWAREYTSLIIERGEYDA